MNFDNTADESLVAYYENVRRQVDADIKSGGSYRFIGESVKQYADRLGEEMDRRRLRFTPIDLATLTEQSIWHACESATCARVI